VVGRLWLLVAVQALTTASDRLDDAGLARLFPFAPCLNTRP